MQHAPTVVALILLYLIGRKQPLSNRSYTLIFIWMMMHVLGAHYLYSFVPYDDWSRTLLGVSVTDIFGLKRNHYDRLVHFCHGLLLLQPMRELVIRWVRIDGIRAVIVALAMLGVLSTLYELAEWLIAVVMDPDAAERYNGQQGDMFDAQKDMGLALLGASFAALIMIFRLERKARAMNHRTS
jgi:putative membrane protein